WCLFTTEGAVPAVGGVRARIDHCAPTVEDREGPVAHWLPHLGREQVVDPVAVRRERVRYVDQVPASTFNYKDGVRSLNAGAGDGYPETARLRHGQGGLMGAGAPRVRSTRQ